MDDNRLRFGVGVLVIAAIGIGVILTFLFGAFPAILSREYELTVYFPSAEGINTNSPVLRDGVKIGRVSDIQLRDEGGVLLTLAMDAEFTMSHRYIPQIGIGSLITGDSKLEFRKAEPKELQVLFENDADMIEQTYSDEEYFAYGQKLEDPFSLIFGMEDELRSTFSSIRGAGDAVQGIGSSIQSLVRDVRDVIGLEDSNPSSNPFPNQSTSLRGRVPGIASKMPPAPNWATNRATNRGAHRGNVDIHLASNQALSSNQPHAGVLQTIAFQNQRGLPSQRGGMAPPAGATADARPSLLDLQNEALMTLRELQGAISDARSILGNEQIRQGLADSVGRLPGVLDEANETLQTTQRTFESFAEVGVQLQQVGDVAEEALTELKGEAAETLQSFSATAKNVEAITEPLGRRSEELILAVLRSLANVDNALIQIDTFGQAVNTSDGTIRRLLEDDELYYEFRRTLENVEAATARVRPILDDVRVFTDKIARDPRQLGVRGALGKRPTGAGLK